MYFPLTLALLALAPSTLAVVQYNASTLTNSAQLSAVIDGIVASYFPTSIFPSLAVAIGSASVTGEPEALISDLISATTPPPYLSALPTPYQSRITVAEGLIVSLRSARDSIIQASISSVDSRTKASISSLINNQTRIGNITMAAVTGTLGNGNRFVTTVPAVVVNGTTVTSGVTPIPTETPSPSSPSGTAADTSSSSGFGIPTQVPLAAAGLVGVLGLLAAL